MTSIIFAEQYGTACCVPYADETADELIERCQMEGAVFYEDGPADECYVVQLRPDVGPEIWTAAALRKATLPKPPNR